MPHGIKYLQVCKCQKHRSRYTLVINLREDFILGMSPLQFIIIDLLPKKESIRWLHIPKM